MSPYKGGPVHLWLRSSIVWLRRFPGRHWMRWIERNSDYQKMCLMGMPEFHIDPTKNRWRYYIDTSYYGGMLDKSHEDFYRYILLYPAIAFFLHCTWCRIKEGAAVFCTACIALYVDSRHGYIARTFIFICVDFGTKG